MTALDQLLADSTAGDPITGTKWTRKTLRQLSRELRRKGLRVGRNTLRRLLKARHYALRTNRKRLTNERNPDRDRQMRYIARVRRAFQKAGKPVISVDAKKRELVGNFKNAGRTWRQQPLEVLETDFRSDAKGLALPYGIYDLTRNAGYVVIGVSHETAEFAVAAIRTWWVEVGQQLYRGSASLARFKPTTAGRMIPAVGCGKPTCRPWQMNSGWPLPSPIIRLARRNGIRLSIVSSASSV